MRLSHAIASSIFWMSAALGNVRAPAGYAASEIRTLWSWIDRRIARP